MKSRDAMVRDDLNTRGLKATPQRMAVMDAIAAAGGYFTPQELYERLKKKRAGIGLVTVYRALAALSRAGLICRIESTGNARLYARRSRAHHHHLVCERCSRVEEFDGCELDGLAEKLSRETGFTVQSHSLEFQGLCRECGKSVRPPPGAGALKTG